MIGSCYTFTGAFRMKMKDLYFFSISVRSTCEVFPFFLFIPNQQVAQFWGTNKHKAIKNSNIRPKGYVIFQNVIYLFCKNFVDNCWQKNLLKPVITFYFHFYLVLRFYNYSFCTLVFIVLHR